jgi:hypothetical protein
MQISIVFIVLAALTAAGVITLAWALRKSVSGYEDDHGFHLGPEPWDGGEAKR